MIAIDTSLAERVLDTVTDRITAAADHLTALDAAIGDGDHGINMRRGMEAIRAERAAILAAPPGAALEIAGRQIVMKVGGAAGPLFGTLLLQAGRSWPSVATRPGIAAALAAAHVAVCARGKSEPGQKTLLDVLAPVVEALGRGDGLAEVAAAAKAGAEATVPMRALRGRASFLGDRSIGHMDPGARTLQLIVEAIVDVLEGRA